MADKVTDEQLDALADEQLNKKDGDEEDVSHETEEVSEEAKEIKEPEKKEDPPKDSEIERLKLENQRLKSEIGRIPSLQSKVDQLEMMIRQRMENEDTEETEGLVATKDDVINILREEKRKESEIKNQYAETARNVMLDMAEDIDDDDTFVAIYRDAEAHWDHRSNNPQLDARVNFNAAMARHYKALATAKHNPLSKNKDQETEALGGPTETNVKPKEAKAPDLDEYAKDFVKRTGMKSESVVKALKGDMPVYLRGGKF